MNRGDTVFFDLETTSADTETARIVQICIITPTVTWERFVNPGVPIEASTTAVHGITNEDVADKPPFRAYASDILTLFGEHNIGGYRHVRFDLPILIAEFERCDVTFDWRSRKIFDAYVIWLQKETRKLEDAFRKFVDPDGFDNAHDATADTRATAAVLERMFDVFSLTDEEAHELSVGNRLDIAGKFIADADGNPFFNFGKYAGKSLEEVWRIDYGYVSWMQRTFPADTRAVLDNFIKQRST